MKKILIIFLVLFLIPIAFAFVCEDVSDPINVPCTVITPVINCSNYTYNLSNVNTNTSLLIGANLTKMQDSLYNFTFNQPSGDYSIVLCDGSSATITVGYSNGEDYYYFYIIGFVTFFLLIILGFYMDIKEITVIGGMVSCVIAIELFLFGFPSFNSFLMNAFSITFAGLGFYFILSPWFKKGYGG